MAEAGAEVGEVGVVLDEAEPPDDEYLPESVY
jgi:hypothetical protein